MKHLTRFIAYAAFAGMIVIPFGCRLTGNVPMVVIGDSLSAGFQNGSLLDSQQPNGWASLVAAQAGVPLPLPLMAAPGVPAVLQLESVGPPPVIVQSPGVSIGRTNPEDQPYDLAVPGHTLQDVIGDAPKLIPTSSEDIITDLVLGLPLGDNKSQMNEAIQLRPMVLFVWTGSDDALKADSAGMPSAMTPVATFANEFQQLMSTLHAQTQAQLVVANIPDVTSVPYLTPAAVILAEAANATGLSPAQLSEALGIADGDLINATGLSQVEAALAAIAQGKTPAPLTDAGFLTPAEITQVQSTVDQYNSIIAQQVSNAGGLLVDIHSLVQGLAQNGITINNYHATAAFLGGLFSLDGIHPTNTGYALIANQFLHAINARAGTQYPDVNVSAIAAADPLFGPNIKPGAQAHIPMAAAQQADQMMRAH